MRMRENKCLKTAAFFLFSLLIFSVQSRSIISYPENAPISLNLNTTTTSSQGNGNLGSCSFSVRITTSCSSPRYTRDQISLSFGDAYGNQVYAPRIDDPRSGAFEACSVDTYDIRGPCTYDICYLYLYRSGYDGWKVKSVEVYGHNIRSVSFNYNAYIPSDIWYGFNYCSGLSASA